MPTFIVLVVDAQTNKDAGPGGGAPGKRKGSGMDDDSLDEDEDVGE